MWKRSRMAETMGWNGMAEVDKNRAREERDMKRRDIPSFYPFHSHHHQTSVL